MSKHKQLKIRCDSCGGMYNPSRYTVCPTCGAVVLNSVIRSKRVDINTPQEYKALKKAGMISC